MSVYRLTLSLSRHLHQYLDNSVNSSNWSTSPAMYGNSLGSINMNYGTRSYQCSVAYSGSAQNFPTISNPSMYEITRVSTIINYSEGHPSHGSNVAGAGWVSVAPVATCIFGLYTTYPGPSCGSPIANDPYAYTLSTYGGTTAQINLTNYDSNSLMQILSRKPSLLCVIIQAQLCGSGAEMLTPGTTLTLEIEYKAKYIPISAPTWSLNTSNYLYNNKIYVSKNGLTPSGKNKFTLTWRAPSISSESDTFQRYGLYAYINGGNFTTITSDLTNVNTTSYTIDFSTFRYGNNISLEEGDVITFYLSSFGESAGESSRVATSSFYVNHRPSPPIIPNPTIPSYTLSMNFSYSLGTDSQEGMDVSLLWSSGYSATSSEWTPTSSSIITKNDAGEQKAYTYDGWDISDATTFIIKVNVKPSIIVDIQDEENKFVIFSDSQSGYTNDTITITPSKIKEQNNKALTNIRYYIRSAATKNLLSSATVKTLPYDNGSYVINPFSTSSLVYPSQYYQIGVRASDGIEDTDIHWVPDIESIYGGITLTSENTPKILSTDITVGLGNYSSYYKNPTFNITYKLPSIPIGLEKLYYQFSYLSNIQANTWTLLGNRVEFTESIEETRQVTIPYILSNVKFRINIYNASNNETQAVFSQESNSLSYIVFPSWTSNNGNLNLAYAILDSNIQTDGRQYIRPTLSNILSNGTNTFNAFSFNLPIPNSICQLVEPSDLLYKISVTNGTNTVILQDYIAIPNSTINPNFLLSFRYNQLDSLYSKLCANEISERKGPYNLSLWVTFKDSFNNTLESLRSNLIIDFREKPLPTTNITIGRDGIYNPDNNIIDLENLKVSTTTLFPIDVSTLTKEHVILNQETLLVSFSQSLSYPAQNIQEYYCDIYKVSTISGQADTLVKTYILEPADKINNYYKVHITNLFTKYEKYYVRIRAKDTEDYTQNVSLPTNISNNLWGVERESPIMELKGIDITFSKDSLTYNIPDISFTSSSNKISILWPDSYKKTLCYNRAMVYKDIEYEPNCKYSLEFSSSPIFPEEPITVTLLEQTKDNSSYIRNPDENGNIIGAIEGTINLSGGKVYVRGKIEYTTSLFVDRGSLNQQTEIVYSSIISFTGEQPTVSYRKNSVGINSIPDETNVFSIAAKDSKNLITFRGESNEDGEIQQHIIYFNLLEGIVSGEGFMIDGTLIPMPPIVTELEINDFSFKT